MSSAIIERFLITEKDKKDWLNFINKKEKLTDKEILEKKKKLFFY